MTTSVDQTLDVLEFKHVYQGKDTKLCGQACVASILGISLEKAVEIVGHCRGTTTREIAHALGINGRRIRGKLSVPSLLAVRGEGKNWHWVLYEGAIVMDPSLNYKVDFDVWHRRISERGTRVTSHLDLSKGWENKWKFSI